MSVGPAALGNVLVQRLDAVLGTTMSAASANQVSGARPDAVSQPGSLEKPGQADGSPRDPRQGVQTGGARGERAAIVDAKTAAALAWPRAAWSPATTPPLPRPPRWAAPPARFSRCWRSTPTQPRPFKGARHCGPRCIGRPPARCHGRAARRGPAGARRPAPGAARQYARRTTAGRCREQRRQRGDGPERDRRRPGNRRRQDARPDRRHRGRAPAQDPAAAARAALAAQGPAARALGQALREALQTSGLFYESHLADLAFGRANPSELRKEPQADLKQADAQQQQHSAPPRAHAPRRPPAVAPAARTRPPPAAPMRPRPARRSTASTRT